MKKTLINWKPYCKKCPYNKQLITDKEMDAAIRKYFDSLYIDEERYGAFTALIKITGAPVSWAYEVWGELVAMLGHKSNHLRTVAAQLLCSLAKSDTDGRMVKDIEAILKITKDKKFVTARHSLQSLWKAATANKPLQNIITAQLTDRFINAMKEKNGTLICYDIAEVFRRMYNITNDEEVKEKALALINTEEDLKYKKKYLGLWKDAAV